VDLSTFGRSAFWKDNEVLAARDTPAFTIAFPMLRTCSEGPQSADPVEKLTFANAEIAIPNLARAPFLSGFARLLRRRKDLSQFPEVLGGCGEQEFIICAAWTT